MKLLLKNRILDLLATFFLYCGQHCNCWRFGHDWQLGPLNAWCAHCEKRITGEKAFRMFGQPCAPEPPREPFVIEDDRVYFINLDNFRRLPDDSIVKLNADGSFGETVVPPVTFVPLASYRVAEGGPIMNGWHHTASGDK